MKKKFKRNSKDKLISGVLGGVALYFGFDSTIVRIVWLLTLGVTGFIPGIMVYIVATLIFPLDNQKISRINKIKRKISKAWNIRYKIKKHAK